MNVNEIFRDYVNSETEVIVDSVPVQFGDSMAFGVILKKRLTEDYIRVYVSLKDIVREV